MKKIALSFLCVTVCFIHAHKLPQVPPGFGKKHFVIGMPRAYAQRTQKTSTLPHKLLPRRVFFSPQDNLEKEIISLIERERKSVKVAVYSFTNKNLVAALVDAKKRGVEVAVITDESCERARFNKLADLHEHGVPVYVYGREQRSAIPHPMHHKFMLLECNECNDNKSMMVVGSANWTHSAMGKNQENINILLEPEFIDAYRKQWEQMQKESKKFNG